MNWRLFHHKSGCEHPFPAVCIRFAVVCLLLLAAWCVFPKAQVFGATAAAPTVVLADSRKPPKVSEAALLAHRILARETDDLLLDAKRRRELAREIEGVLVRLRYAHPEVAEIFARAAHLPGVLLLGVKPDLMDTVSRLLRGKSGPVKLRTGKAAFDALNAKLRLRAVRLFRRTGVLLMRLSERANVQAARRAYLKIAGVEYAESDAHLGDGSDIEASKSGDAWHLVVRKAWGDCPSGCIYKKMFFFTVRGEKIERIEPSKATGMPEFRKLLETRKWR